MAAGGVVEFQVTEQNGQRGQQRSTSQSDQFKPLFQRRLVSPAIRQLAKFRSQFDFGITAEEWPGLFPNSSAAARVNSSS